jgi:hypothetical protein
VLRKRLKELIGKDEAIEETEKEAKSVIERVNSE